MTDLDKGPQRVRALTRLSVDGLFGRYFYDLPMGGEILDSQLAILYGENGAGKTTILRLLHNSVSCADNRGHKTDILKVPFKSFTAHFSGGIVLSAFREEAESGTYHMEFRKRGQKACRTTFTAIEGRIPGKGPQSEEHDGFMQAVHAGLELDSFFLADERILDSDLFEEDEEEEPLTRYVDSQGRTVRTVSPSRLMTQRDRQLMLTLRRVTQWVRQQVLTGASTGSVNANSIYADVIKRLSSSPEDPLGTSISASDIINDLNWISVRSADHARFGLTPQIQTRDMIDAIRKTPPERRSLIIGLLQPYLDTNKARLDAMDQPYKSIKAFTEHLNSFLIDKEISFDLRQGPVVHSSRAGAISPENLSSGEKHLLMLFCNLLVSRQHPSLFLIDEPELSLNIKWQRKLVPALLSMTAGSQIQLLMATHSLELLSSYRPRVMRLPFGVD